MRSVPEGIFVQKSRLFTSGSSRLETTARGCRVIATLAMGSGQFADLMVEMRDLQPSQKEKRRGTSRRENTVNWRST